MFGDSPPSGFSATIVLSIIAVEAIFESPLLDKRMVKSDHPFCFPAPSSGVAGIHSADYCSFAAKEKVSALIRTMYIPFAPDISSGW